MGRTSFDFDVISGPAPSRTPPQPPAPTQPASNGGGTAPAPDIAGAAK